MKSIYLILTALLISCATIAQDIQVYGFYSEGPLPSANLPLGKLNAITGEVLEVDSVFTINAYALGSSSFDQVNQYYSFTGIDTGFMKRFVSWDVENKSIVNQPLFSETINDIQYDMNAMVYYGLGNYIVDTLVYDTMFNIYVYEYASRLLTLDPLTGDVEELAKIPNLRAFPVGGSTFDANNGRYIINAADSNNMGRLFVLDAASGTILSDNLLNLDGEEYLNELEYNNVDNKLYGLYRNNGTGEKSIVSVDLQSNEITPVATLDQLQYFTQGASVFHQQSESFILYYINNDNTQRLLTVDVTTGETIADPEISGTFTEIEVDNNEFAMLAYHTQTAVSEKRHTSSSMIYPNPSRGTINLNGFINAEQIQILDMSGRVVRSVNPSGETITTINLNGLQEGMYLIVGSGSGESWYNKVILEY